MGQRRSTSTMLGILTSVVCALLVLVAAPPAGAVDWRQVRLESKTVSAAGTSFAYAVVGSGPPLVMLNGTASPMSQWDPALLGHLSDHHAVIVFDYPGLGASGPAPTSWTFDHAASWIAAFISTVAPGEPVDILGWSMGGFIAQRLAVMHPELVRHLILAATNPGGDRTTLGPTWVQEADSAGAGYLRTNYPSDRQGAGRAFLARLRAAEASGAYPSDAIPAATATAMVSAEDPWLRSSANLRSLRRITAPTLVIDGAEDLVTPPDNSRVIASRVPGARLRLMRDAGHSFLFQQPRVAASWIRDFLTSHDAVGDRGGAGRARTDDRIVPTARARIRHHR